MRGGCRFTRRTARLSCQLPAQVGRESPAPGRTSCRQPGQACTVLPSPFRRQQTRSCCIRKPGPCWSSSASGEAASAALFRASAQPSPRTAAQRGALTACSHIPCRRADVQGKNAASASTAPHHPPWHVRRLARLLPASPEKPLAHLRRTGRLHHPHCCGCSSRAVHMSLQAVVFLQVAGSSATSSPDSSVMCYPPQAVRTPGAGASGHAGRRFHRFSVTRMRPPPARTRHSAEVARMRRRSVAPLDLDPRPAHQVDAAAGARDTRGS